MKTKLFLSAVAMVLASTAVANANPPFMDTPNSEKSELAFPRSGTAKSDITIHQVSEETNGAVNLIGTFLSDENTGDSQHLFPGIDQPQDEGDNGLAPIW